LANRTVGDYPGRDTEMVVEEGWESRVTVPPWAETMAWTRERPSPAPLVSARVVAERVRETSPRTKRSNAVAASSGGKPGPSSWIEKPGPGRRACR
jgi:hypothetical protein